MLNPRNPTPLYHQLYEALRDAIATGQYRAHELLPSEADIGKSYEVSRITVRRAIDELRLRNYIVREKGVGTRVVGRSPTSSSILGGIEGMLENHISMGLETDVDVVEFEYIDAPLEVLQKLRLDANEKVQHSVRVRSYHGQAFSYLTTYIPERIGRSFNRSDLSSMPLLLILEQKGWEITEADQAITAVEASPIAAQYLRVPEGKSLLKIERTAFDKNKLPVQHITSLYNPEMYHYQMKLSRESQMNVMQWRHT